MVTVWRGSGLRYFGSFRGGEVRKWGETGCGGLCAGSVQVGAQLRIRATDRVPRDLSLIRLIHLLGLVKKTLLYASTCTYILSSAICSDGVANTLARRNGAVL